MAELANPPPRPPRSPPNVFELAIELAVAELPEDRTADQLAAWVELAEVLRDPEYVAASRRMAQRAPGTRTGA